MRRLRLALLLSLCPLGALAHDTVLLAPPGPKPADAPVELALSSIERFPTLDYGPRADRVQAALASTGAVVVLERRPEALHLRWVTPRPGLHVAAVTLKPHTLTLSASEIAHYLDDIDASPALRARAAGLTSWTETYVKHVKAQVCIDPCGDARPATRPLGAVLEFVAGDDARRFVLLRAGRPLPGQPVAVEWSGGARRFIRTDAQGVVALPAEARGATLLSTVRLLPPARDGANWTSDFATLTLTL